MCKLTSCKPAFKYLDQYIGIKIFLSCINICKVQVLLLKTEREARYFQQHPRDLANANAMKNKVWSLLLYKFSQTATKQWKCIGNYCSVYRPDLFWFLYSQGFFFINILDSDHGQLLRLFSFITLLSIPAIDNLKLPFFTSYGPEICIRKAAKRCIKCAWISLFIYGFWPVNARLLLAYVTAF